VATRKQPAVQVVNVVGIRVGVLACSAIAAIAPRRPASHCCCGSQIDPRLLQAIAAAAIGGTNPSRSARCGPLSGALIIVVGNGLDLRLGQPTEVKLILKACCVSTGCDHRRWFAVPFEIRPVAKLLVNRKLRESIKRPSRQSFDCAHVGKARRVTILDDMPNDHVISYVYESSLHKSLLVYHTSRQLLPLIWSTSRPDSVSLFRQ